MPIRLRTINNEIVKPIQPLEPDDIRPVRGAKLIPKCNSVIFIAAKRNSGKTSLIWKVSKDTIGKDTKIIIFCANLYRDKSWRAMQVWFENNGIELEGHTSIVENGVDHLAELDQSIQDEAEIMHLEKMEEAEQKLMPKQNKEIKIFDEDDDKPKKKRRSKYQTPKYLIIFDDMSTQLKKPSLISLLKNGRHFCKVIISTQYVLDIPPEARKQVEYWMLFRSHPLDKLQTIYKDAELSIPFEEFLKIYYHATQDKYNFLYIDVDQERFRRCFNKEYDIEETEDNGIPTFV